MDDMFRESTEDDTDSEGEYNVVPRCFSWISALYRHKRPNDLASLGDCDIPGIEQSSPATSKMLFAPARAFSKCVNLQDITIIIYDHVLTVQFRYYMDELWKTLGNTVQKLTVATTLHKVPELLKAIGKSSATLSALEALDISIANSRFPEEKDTTANAIAAIVNIIHKFRGSISDLTLSSSVDVHLAPLFVALGALPKLSKIKILLPFSEKTLPQQGDALSQFFQLNSGTIEEITFGTRARSTQVFCAYVSEETLNSWIHTELPRIVFPKLKMLELGLQDRTRRQLDDTPPALLPSLPPFLPALEILILTSVTLTLADLAGVLDKANGQLRGLECSVECFTPAMFALLVNKAPRLTRLNLTYGRLEQDSDNAHSNLTVITAPGVHVYMPGSIYLTIYGLRYPNWPLRYLRIGLRHHMCGICHPDSYLGNLMKTAISGEVEVDLSFICECDPLGYRTACSDFD